MLFQPFSDAGNRALVCVWGRMWTVENSYLFKQDDSNATSLSLSDFCTQLSEQSFDVAPLNICACRVSKDQLQCALVLSFHSHLTPCPCTTLATGRDGACSRLTLAWAASAGHSLFDVRSMEKLGAPWLRCDLLFSRSLRRSSVCSVRRWLLPAFRKAGGVPLQDFL